MSGDIALGRMLERNEIIKELEERSVLDCVAEDFEQYKAGYDYAVGIIKRRGGTKVIEKVQIESPMGRVTNSSSYMAEKINELVAAVNELKEKV
jgi:uncharacterized protein YbaA (DUF1428 family)